MDHLACFLAGTLALGAQTADDPNIRERDMKTAKVKGRREVEREGGRLCEDDVTSCQ